LEAKVEAGLTEEKAMSTTVVPAILVSYIAKAAPLGIDHPLKVTVMSPVQSSGSSSSTPKPMFGG
jgi:hypothetical protein